MSSFVGIIFRLGFKGIIEDYLFQPITLSGYSGDTYYMSKPFRDILPKPSLRDGLGMA
jgi:hypothetical protein